MKKTVRPGKIPTGAVSLLEQLATLGQCRELVDFIDELQAENTTLKNQVAKYKWMLGRVELSREEVRGMKLLADKVRILERTKVCFPLFGNVEGGPLWFHYDCRCASEAQLILESVRKTLSEIWMMYSRGRFPE